MFLFRKVHAKFPSLFELSGCAKITILVILGMTIYHLVRGVQYLAVVMAGPLRVLRAVCAPEYVPLHVIVVLGLVYTLRKSLARHWMISPIGTSSYFFERIPFDGLIAFSTVSIVVAFCDLVSPGKAECGRGQHMKPIHPVPNKVRTTVSERKIALISLSILAKIRTCPLPCPSQVDSTPNSRSQGHYPDHN